MEFIFLLLKSGILAELLKKSSNNENKTKKYTELYEHHRVIAQSKTNVEKETNIS